jgi:hypothetical protein
LDFADDAVLRSFGTAPRQWLKTASGCFSGLSEKKVIFFNRTPAREISGRHWCHGYPRPNACGGYRHLED